MLCAVVVVEAMRAKFRLGKLGGGREARRERGGEEKRVDVRGGEAQSRAEQN